jgi:hypothetical protein
VTIRIGAGIVFVGIFVLLGFRVDACQFIGKETWLRMQSVLNNRLPFFSDCYRPRSPCMRIADSGSWEVVSVVGRPN